MKINYNSFEFVYEEFEYLEQLLEKYPYASYVALTSKGDEFLHEYEHPEEDVIYVTGSDYGDLHEKTFRDYLVDFVKIKCGKSPPLWANQASTIALYDRSVKE